MNKVTDFSLKKWKPEYAESISLYANNINIAKFLRNIFPFPYVYNDAVEYIDDCIKNDGINQLCRAIVVDNKAVGSIGVFVKDDVYSKSAELGYWLGEPFWNKGIMSSAIKQICEEAFLKFDIVRIFAEPYAVNAGSKKALEKAGFELEGILRKSVFKNGEFLDSCVYSLIK